jgi:L-ribulose-5-phosphate 3-epimerase
MERAETSRRDFLRVGMAAAGATLIGKRGAAYNGTVCLFSKHLPGTNWERLAETVKRLGFGGIDLTVRTGGHVLPVRAAEDLPRAVAAIRAQGLEVPMITTELLSADDPTARPILTAAGKLGIKRIKPGYYKYAFADVRRELETAGKQLTGLIGLARECGVEVGYHNHAGNIGGPVWDIARIIDPLDARWAGYYFDVRHAVVEGGAAGWKIAFNLVAPRLKMIAIKDVYWEKTAKGWAQKDCPLGEGMVDWPAYFKMLRAVDYQGPISLHVEYELGGTTAAEKETRMIEAITRDFGFLKRQIQTANMD